MRGGRRATAVLVAATLLVACGSNIEHQVPGGPSFESAEVRFVAPTGWEVRRSTQVAGGRAVRFLYLANQPLRDDCSTTGSDILCHPPIGGLNPGGILVTWVVQPCVAEGCDLPSGQLIAIGNRKGVGAPMDAGCQEFTFTERMAYYVTVTPQRVDILIICARELSDTTRAAFLGFLDAIHWRIP